MVQAERATGSSSGDKTCGSTQVKEENDDDDVPPPPPPPPPPGQPFKLPPPPDPVVGALKVDTVKLSEARDHTDVTAGTVTLQENAEVTKTRRFIHRALHMAVHSRKTHGLSREVEQMVVGLSRLPKVPEKLPCRISFCITCFNREWQLFTTLCVNLATQEGLLAAGGVRFVLLLVKDLLLEDAEKQYEFDDMVAYLRQTFAEEIRSGALVVGIDEARAFHSPIFKNAAHRLAILTPWCGVETEVENLIVPKQKILNSTDAAASGGCTPDQSSVKAEDGSVKVDHSSAAGSGRTLSALSTFTASWPLPREANQERHILISLDADNILAQDFCRGFVQDPQIADKLNLPLEVMWGFRFMSGTDSGCTGRVGCPEETFLQVGGYDQEMLPTGYQDLDLWERFCSAGVGIKLYTPCGWSIPNTMSRAKKAHTKAKALYARCDLPWSQQNDSNRQRSKELLGKGIWWRNSEERPSLDDQASGEFLGSLGILKEEDEAGFYPKRLGARPKVRPTPKSHKAARGSAEMVVPPGGEMVVPPVRPTTKKRASPFVEAEKKTNVIKPSIISIGLGNLEEILPNLGCDPEMVKKHRNGIKKIQLRANSKGDRQIEEWDLKAILDDLGITNRKDAAFFVDMRPCHDPEDVKKLSGHCGLHPEIMLSVAKHQWFQEAVLNLRQKLKELMDIYDPQKGGPVLKFAVVTYCRKGTHRSSAAGELLHHAMTSYGCQSVAQTDGATCVHLTEAAGEWKRPRRCGPCAVCMGQTEAELGQKRLVIKKNAYHLARRLWHMGEA